MKYVGMIGLIFAFSACGGGDGNPGHDGGTDASHDSGPVTVPFDASGLTTCSTWGSIYWMPFDAGAGVGYCTSTGPASDCVATSPDQVLHLCHCTPTDGGGSNELVCE